MADATAPPDTGPIVGWGKIPLDSSNEVIDFALQPPCIGSDFMCETHEDSLNPQTGYRVCASASSIVSKVVSQRECVGKPVHDSLVSALEELGHTGNCTRGWQSCCAGPPRSRGRRWECDGSSRSSCSHHSP